MATVDRVEADMVDMSLLVGSIRRLGLAGPAYQVVGPTAQSPSGETQMRIHLLESDEDVDYPLDDLLRDPEAD